MKVITFSRYFPVSHPRKGDPTFFVEKMLLSFIDCGIVSIGKAVEVGREIGCIKDMQSTYELRKVQLSPKHHTIRAGSRWKVGDQFSARVWSGKPYASKQIEFAQPVIKKIWNVRINFFQTSPVVELDGSVMAYPDFYPIAHNDGLTITNFISWFNCHPKAKNGFEGQIICWNENIIY